MPKKKQDDMFTLTALTERGWTKSMVTKLLSSPDKTAVNLTTVQVQR